MWIAGPETALWHGSRAQRRPANVDRVPGSSPFAWIAGPEAASRHGSRARKRPRGADRGSGGGPVAWIAGPEATLRCGWGPEMWIACLSEARCPPFATATPRAVSTHLLICHSPLRRREHELAHNVFDNCFPGVIIKR